MPPAPGQTPPAAVPQDAAPQAQVVPDVVAEQIPAELRQTLAKAGMDVESMEPETRMTIALMASQREPAPAADNPLQQSSRESTKQKSMEEILMKAQKMYQMSEQERKAELQQEVQENPGA